MTRHRSEKVVPPSSQKSVDEMLKGKAPFADYDRGELLKKAKE